MFKNPPVSQLLNRCLNHTNTTVLNVNQDIFHISGTTITNFSLLGYDNVFHRMNAPDTEADNVPWPFSMKYTT